MIRVTLLLVLVSSSLLFSACSAKKKQTNNPDNVEWFCQSNESGSDWDCVQDNSLAEVPVPTRMPPAPDTREQVFDDSLDPLGLDSQAAELTQGTSAISVAAGAVATGPKSATGVVQNSASVSVDAQDNATATGATTASTALPLEGDPVPEFSNDDSPPQVPRYVQLAYVPPEPTSIMALPADFFAIQVLSMDSPEQLENYVLDNGMQGIAAARVEDNGSLKYVLLLGIYTTAAKANEAATELPPPLDTVDGVWVRPLGDLQQAIVRADKLVSAKPDESKSEVP